MKLNGADSNYVVDRIQSTPLSMVGGYPWMHVTDFLPDEQYKKIAQARSAQALVDAYDDPAIVSALYEKFSGHNVRQSNIRSIYAFWQSSGAGYSLKPHEDSWPRVFTIVFYFAEDDSYPEAGTSIYEVDEKQRTYRTVATAPYLPNSASIIAPETGKSWHGVDLIKRPVDRQSAVLVFSAEEWNSNQLHYADWKPGKTVNYER